MEVVLDVNLDEEEDKGHHKDGEKGEKNGEEVDVKYQLDQRDGDALKELVTAALLKTRKSQVFHLLLSLLLIPALFFFSTICSSSIFPTWLITTIVVILTSSSCFAALLALITFQQRAIAFENVIERLD